MAAHPEFTRFLDRRDAGRRLGGVLAERDFENPVVIGMVRGGVPVAAEVARALGAPLDIALVRKIGAPDQPELAIGAIAEGDASAIDAGDAERLGIDSRAVDVVIARERLELARRADLYRAERPPLPLAGRTAILVDDGIATGHTAMAAARSLAARGATRIVLAVPVCPAERARAVPEPPVDELICVTAPINMPAVGYWYADFPQVADDEVIASLREARGPEVRGDPRRGAAAAERPPREIAVAVDTEDGVRLPGDLSLPARVRGVVLFAHGSGSSRHSPRNRMVADRLVAAGVATLLLDLLTDVEADDRAKVFDIDLPARRLAAAERMVAARDDTRDLPVGLFGASTGAAAALVAAAASPDTVRAVVSRGGRPDLARDALPLVRAPTLLIVGAADTEVIELNRLAAGGMTCRTELAIVPGAGHLFEGAGELEQVAELAATWFLKHLGETEPG